MFSSNLLKNVSRPGRYSGGEYGQTIKNKNDIKLRFAFCFPDTYEIGMSNLGMKILYGCLNEMKDVWCERVFAPWHDMEGKMRDNGLKLTAHESGDSIDSFDIVAFTLQYELCYSNVLNMLELGDIPLFSRERTENDPIVIGGGPCAYNAEPVADFFDIFSIGEGEEALPELCSLYIEMKESGEYSRSDFLHRAAKLEGFYVPSLYKVEYNDDNTVKEYLPIYDDIPRKIKKRIIKDLDKSYFPIESYMPYIETVQDRITLEVYRGCIRGCRFCQAGMVYRPIREKSPEVLCRQAKQIYEKTGYDEISLCCLSISDYSEVDRLCDMLLEWTDEEMVSLSLPSLRVDSFTKELMDKVSSVRTGGITFAPEAGTQRMRDVINKCVTEEDLIRAVNVAFSAKKTSVKLYFMDGLPTETLEDVGGIAELAKHVLDAYYLNPERNRMRAPQVTISVACFIPKPFTPFQWEAQNTIEELDTKQEYLKNCITDKKIRYTYHNKLVSKLEAAFARGSRLLAPVILEAHKMGAKFDAWDECFSYDLWMEAFRRCGVDPAFYANREIPEDETLPWDIIDIGVTKKYLISERRKAYGAKTTDNCRLSCKGCGASSFGGERSCCK